MDVLNAIKVQVPPELREMLLEFVVCYLIDRPADPHSYAAAHFLNQEKLRHSHMVHYTSYMESKKAPPTEEVVLPKSAIRTDTSGKERRERKKREKKAQQVVLAPGTFVDAVLKPRVETLPKEIKIKVEDAKSVVEEVASDVVERKAEDVKSVLEVASKSVLEEVASEVVVRQEEDDDVEATSEVPKISLEEEVDLKEGDGATSKEAMQTLAEVDKDNGGKTGSLQVDLKEGDGATSKEPMQTLAEGDKDNGGKTGSYIAARTVVDVVHSASETLTRNGL